MLILHISVSNKIATYLRRDGAIVCGNSDYMIEFSFDSEWDNHAVKTARFLFNNNVVDVVFEGNVVEVPVLRNTTLARVGVYAGDLQTTTPAEIPCIKSILCEDGLPPDPAPEVYTQIMEKLKIEEPVNVNLSAMNTTGEIVETFADNTVKTTTIEFDEEGNPIRITDSSGHATTFTW